MFVVYIVVVLQRDMLSFPELIKKKRDGQILNDDDIRDFIAAVTSANIQDSQIGKGTTHMHTYARTRTPISVVAQYE